MPTICVRSPAQSGRRRLDPTATNHGMRTDPRLQTVIDHPLHQALGVRAIESQNGCGRMEFIAEGMTINPAGMLHGGVLYTLADVCAYAGLLSRLEPHQEAVTHDLHVSVLRPVTAGQSVTITSRIVRLGRAVCFLDAEVQAGGKTIATARVTKTLITRPST